MSVATNLLQEALTDQNSMEIIIIGDKTRVYGYDQKRNVNLRSGSSPSLQAEKIEPGAFQSQSHADFIF
jgi:hypothetical protein